MTTAIGWILWALVGLGALIGLLISLSPGDPGGRWVFRVQALTWLVGVVVTAALPISKFHLIWIFPLGAVAPYAIINWRMQRRMDLGIGPFATAIKHHLEEESGGEVWTWPEMRRLFKVYESTSPCDFAARINHPEFEGWWLTKEPEVGEVKVIRRADKLKGTLYFKDSPRFYFSWIPD